MFIRAFLLLTFSAYVFANEQALVIYTEEFPPYNYTVNGDVTGINIQMVKIACREAEIDCVFKVLPWNRAMRDALEGPNTAIMSTARTSEREAKFQWVGPLKSSQNCIYKLAGRDDIVIPNLAATQHYVMGATKDTAHAAVLSNLGFVEGKNLNLYQGKFGSLKPFAAQRVDIVMGSANTIQEQFGSIGLSLSDIEPVAIITREFLNGNYLALHPAIRPEVVERLQGSMRTMNESGLSDQIEQDFVQDISLLPSAKSDSKLWRDCMKKGYKITSE